MRSPASIDKLTTQILATMGITSAPVDVQLVASKLGARIRYQVAEDDISGALFRDPGNGVPVIGVNVSHVPVRQRFTIAHEIGHLHLHNDDLHVDRSLAGVGSVGSRLALRAHRNRLTRTAGDPKEVEANRFAASLLMPTQFLSIDLEKFHGPLRDTDVAELASSYQVSSQAMAFRLINLGVPLEYAHV